MVRGPPNRLMWTNELNCLASCQSSFPVFRQLKVAATQTIANGKMTAKFQRRRRPARRSKSRGYAALLGP